MKSEKRIRDLLNQYEFDKEASIQFGIDESQLIEPELIKLLKWVIDEKDDNDVNYVQLMHGKVDELNKLLGDENCFWINSASNEYSLANSECMFYGYRSAENMYNFLNGVILAIKCGFRKDIFSYNQVI